MTEKDMVSHIKALTKVIERQAEYAEQMNRKFASFERSVSILAFRLAKLEGMKAHE